MPCYWEARDLWLQGLCLLLSAWQVFTVFLACAIAANASVGQNAPAARKNRVKILISGASGFIGSSLLAYCGKQGDQPVALHDAPDLEGWDAFVHLAGEPLSLGRWSLAKQKKIKESRVEATAKLCDRLLHLKRPPKVFLSASAIGYYGDRGDDLLSEEESPGAGFLAQVCVGWERASEILKQRDIRVIHARFGIVLGSHGGIFKKLALLYRCCLGAKFGSGSQWVSWIALSDLIRAIHHAMRSEMQGAINMASPCPVRQKEFAQRMAHHFRRPLLFAIPAWALKTALGFPAYEPVLFSQRADVHKLCASGFHHQYPTLQECLASID